MAMISCKDGCVCEPETVDASHSAPPPAGATAGAANSGAAGMAGRNFEVKGPNNGSHSGVRTTGGGHESVLRTRTLRVSPHPNCRMRVEVLQETTSGGHKFKLSSVTTRVLM